MNDFDRGDFGTRQAEMTARWYDNVKRQHGDVDAYIETRNLAYLDRWKEAGRFIPQGADVLDIGGGNISPIHASYFKDRDFAYNYVDVDPAALLSSRTIAERQGVKVGRFEVGFNDDLDFADGSFDAVFSSHCIEHSIDLHKTFAEINRVLRTGGNLLMAVPFGWEMNPEHPYFFGLEEWIALTQAAGFEVRVAQIGREYPEYGHDLFIAARKVSTASAQCIDPNDYCKINYSFLGLNDEGIRIDGPIECKEDHVIMRGEWELRIDVPEGCTEVLPIFQRHGWSGVVEDSSTTKKQWDLFSWFTYTQPIRIELSDGVTNAAVKVVGRNVLSASSEGVLFGAMYR